MTDPSGLLQLGYRFYWPEIGRFLQREPKHGPAYHRALMRLGVEADRPKMPGRHLRMVYAGVDTGAAALVSGPRVGPGRAVGHPYVYADNQPVVYVDPSGFDYTDIAINVGPVIGGFQLTPGDPCGEPAPPWWDVWGKLKYHVHPYLGIGAGTGGVSSMYAPGQQYPKKGWYLAAQAGWYAGGSGGIGLQGQGPFGEVGGAWGAWGGVYYVW